MAVNQDETRQERVQRMMDQHGDGLLKPCFMSLRDVHLAEDAVQETFLLAYRKLHTFRGDSSEYTWLSAIAINVCRSLRRKNWFRMEDLGVSMDKLPEASEPFTPQDDTVVRTVMGLPEKYRDVITLHYFQNIKYREIAEALSSRARVAMSVGPLPVLLEPYGDLEEDEAYDMFLEVMQAGAKAGADLFLVQTFMDLAMMQVALRAAGTLNKPVMAAFSFEARGRTMMGNSVADIVEGLKDFPLEALGMNCSLGPEQALPILEDFRKHTDRPLLFKPNAGLPVGGKENPAVDALAFATETAKAATVGATYIGGCCGSNPAYIRLLAQTLEGMGA